MSKRAWVALLGLIAVSGLTAQDRFGGLPMYEDQMAGVQLGWQARTITGIWNFDRVETAQSQRLFKTYKMPDHIIMRLGTKMPAAQGSGSGEDGTLNFYFGPYGRGVSESAATGGGGGPAGGDTGSGGPPGGTSGGAGSAGIGPPVLGEGRRPPTDDEVRDKLRDKLAEAMGRPPSQMAGPAMGGGGLIGGAGAGPGFEGTGPDLGAGGQPFGGFGGGTTGLASQFNIQPATGRFAEIQHLYYADREVIIREAQKFYERFLGLQERVVTARAEGRDEDATAAEAEMSRVLGMLMQIAGMLQSSDVYHVFHVGVPDRDIVLCYELAKGIWASFTVDFYAWVVRGISVCGYGPYTGAQTSAAPSGRRGVRLGDSLEHIFNRYGWPDGFESFLGRYLLVHYYDSNNVGFLLDHPAPKVYRVIRIIIEPRPNAQERQLAGVQLGLNGQDLLQMRDRAGRPIFANPDAWERPNHRVSIINRQPEGANQPPGMLLDRRLNSVFGGTPPGAGAVNIPGLGGGGGAGGAGAGPAGPGMPGEGGTSAGMGGRPGGPPIGGGSGMGPGMMPPSGPPRMGLGRTQQTQSAADRRGQPIAEARPSGPPIAGAGPPGGTSAGAGPGGDSLGALGGGGAGGGGGATNVATEGGGPVLVWPPMPFFVARDGFNVEALCGADATASGGGGPGAPPAPPGPPTGEARPAGPPIGGAGPPAGGPGMTPTGPPGAAGSGGAPSGPGGLPGAGPVGAAGGGGGTGGADRSALVPILNDIYGDETDQVGFNLAYGCRESEGSCFIASCIEDTAYRWDYGFAPDVRVEFGVDLDGLCTQIGVMGRSWGGARSGRGVALGSRVNEVLMRYGPPLLYEEFIQDVNDQQPNIQMMFYTIDDRGRPYGNVSFALQDRLVTAMQIVALGVE